MPGRIPENILDDILGRVDIVELIAGYIPLKRAGRNFRANCPFHHEKTPSFMVSPDRQIYHCFGCNAGGNAFSFLMQYERLEFLEAVEELAKKAGINLPQAERQEAKTESLVSQLYKINEIAASFYESLLNSGAGAGAKSYLHKRGLSEEAIKLFKAGLAVDKWDSLINHLRAGGISLSLLEKAGLILSKERGGYYDRFRNRIIFPIFDIKSRVIAFGARVLDNTLPKYMNSPETAIYTKGKNLYGLNFSKDAVRENDQVIIVEGYLDFIMPYQAGAKNIVASLGTALTIDQIRLIKRYTYNVVMVYDPDTAGQMATLRSLDMFVEEGMDVRVVSLPSGLDPDLFVRKNGAEGFKNKVLAAENLFDYKLRILKARHNSKDIQAKARISQEMLPTINKFKNEVLRSEYIKKLAEELKVDEGALLQELKHCKSDKPYAGQENNLRQDNRLLQINETEKLLIRLMLEEADFIRRISQALSPEDFQDARVSRVVSTVFDLCAQGRSVGPSTLLNYLEDASILPLISESALIMESMPQDKEKILDDCIKRIKIQKLKLKRQRIHEEIKSAQQSGDGEKVHLLMQEFHDLMHPKASNTIEI